MFLPTILPTNGVQEAVIDTVFLAIKFSAKLLQLY